LAPGENDAEALQEQANQQLSELRSELDKAQAEAGTTPSGEGEAPPPAEPAGEQAGENEGPLMPGMTIPKPMMSFSETRGKSQLEGQFKDLLQKRKIRDW
jgi:hypothetical protein